jgi:hypothetical protein
MLSSVFVPPAEAPVAPPSELRRIVPHPSYAELVRMVEELQLKSAAKRAHTIDSLLAKLDAATRERDDASRATEALRVELEASRTALGVALAQRDSERTLRVSAEAESLRVRADSERAAMASTVVPPTVNQDVAVEWARAAWECVSESGADVEMTFMVYIGAERAALARFTRGKTDTPKTNSARIKRVIDTLALAMGKATFAELVVRNQTIGAVCAAAAATAVPSPPPAAADVVAQLHQHTVDGIVRFLHDTGASMRNGAAIGYAVTHSASGAKHTAFDVPLRTISFADISRRMHADIDSMMRIYDVHNGDNNAREYTWDGLVALTKPRSAFEANMVRLARGGAIDVGALWRNGYGHVYKEGWVDERKYRGRT